MIKINSLRQCTDLYYVFTIYTNQINYIRKERFNCFCKYDILDSLGMSKFFALHLLTVEINMITKPVNMGMLYPMLMAKYGKVNRFS